MSAPITLVTALLAAASAATLAAQAPAPDPLLAPIEPDHAARWLTPVEPVKLFANSYFVGFGGLSVVLIDTGTGLILIDASLPQAVPAVEANIRKLGFDPRDVKLIFSTEPHYDHGGGLAALARDTGATVVAGTAAVRELESGTGDAADPQAEWLVPFPAVPHVRGVRDGERLRLGDTEITAITTPGHTAGSTSWTWRSCAGATCRTMVFGASLNPVSTDTYRFSDPAHRSVVDRFRAGFARMEALPCDMLVTAHPDQSGGDTKLSRLQAGDADAFLDRKACRDYAVTYRDRLDARLKKEAETR